MWAKEDKRRAVVFACPPVEPGPPSADSPSNEVANADERAAGFQDGGSMGDRPPAGGRRYPQVRLARMGDGPDGSPCPRRGAPDRAGGPARRPVVRGGGLRPPRGANRVGAAVSRRRGVLDICARELAPRKIYRCSIRAVRGCRRLRGFVSCEERKACWHLFRLYDAGAHLV